MLNLDFREKVVVDTNLMDWSGSPSEGVMRKSMAWEFPESGHATSLVRFERGASFSPHTHPMGEEILVLDGVFSDENGDYGKGSCFWFQRRRSFPFRPTSSIRRTWKPI